MTGVIDAGGGNRGAFGAGVFDYCLDNQIIFDYCIGISAGAANSVSYIAKQRGRNYKFYTEYNLSRKAINPAKMLIHKSVINLDYIYGTLSNSGGAYPLDYHTFSSSDQKFFAVAEEAETGKARYFSNDDLSEDNYGVISASSCVPIVNDPYVIDGIPYFDGGLADPIPIEKAFHDGCDRVVVILTLPKTFFRTNQKDARYAGRMKKYPASRQAIINRASVYNRELQMALDLEREGKVLIIAPAQRAKIKTLGKDAAVIDRLYREGYASAEAINKFIMNR